MSTTSSSSYYFNCNGRSCRNNQDFTYNYHPTIHHAKKINQFPSFLKFSSRNGILNDRALSMSGNIRPKASSSPSNPSSSSWKKWLVGLLLSVILPAVGHKGGLWVVLKGKIDKAIETVESVAEVVEEVAEEGEKIMEEVEEKLPGDSKLREALESFDDLAKKAVKEAKKAQDMVHKVKDVEEEIEKTLVDAGKGQE